MKRFRPIEGGLSLLLDSLRLGAALVVLLWHAQDMWFPAVAHDPSAAGNPAHVAVVVFFVLSGFVIAFTSSAKHRTLSDYMEARLSRLWSMVIPALIVTALVECVVRIDANPALLGDYVRGPFLPRYLLAGTFLNELWFFSAAPPSNIALWSLSFEFWYYVIFGVWFCTGRGWKSCAFALIACVIAGPKILAMMPIWIMGCAAYWLPRPKIGRHVAWAGTGLMLVAAAGIAASLKPMPFAVGQAPLYFANQFLTDWAIGLLVSVGLWIIPASPAQGPRVSQAWVDRMRACADLTFPIYVLHYPLLVLFRVVFGTRLNDPSQYALAVASVLLVSTVLGVWLEKLRPVWTRQIRKLFAMVRRRIPAARLAAQEPASVRADIAP
jgi:peptidoglycan/LPS O-acetylase OafA/YrhL